MLTQKMIDEHQAQITELLTKAPDGKWKTEPIRMEFKHAGLDCLAIRQSHGAWCGYVGVPEGHPDFGKGYDDVPVDVHGGLTYADSCRDIVCHLVDNEQEKRWWFGFDCVHGWDYAPLMPGAAFFSDIESYKDVPYVHEELEKLAEQLKARG
jgi:hypothetical protein